MPVTEAPQAGVLLQLMWLASPALPVGGFSYSEGLEAAIEAGLVEDERGAAHWLLDQLRLTLARSDLPVVAEAVGAWQRGDIAAIRDLNAWTCETRESRELRQQTEQTGRALLAWLNNGGSQEDPRLADLSALAPAPTWPVAFALAAARGGATADQATIGFAFGWAENLVQAAMKCVPLGQAAGQRILAALVDAIPETAGGATRLARDDRQSFSPMLAVLSAQHENQYSRLFRS